MNGHHLAGLAAGVAAVLVAPIAAAAAPNADAELIALCARFDALTRYKGAVMAIPGLTIAEEKERDRTLAPLRAEQERLLDQITDTDMAAKTLEGVKARYRMIMLYGPECIESASDWEEMMIGAFLLDLGKSEIMGMIGAGTPEKPETALASIPDRLRPGEVSPDSIASVRDDLHGLALLAVATAGLDEAGHQIEAEAVQGLGDLARQARDRLDKALADAKART
ncbi:hypothetical protein AiwAL_16810 [Acidiphilium sp. AL]|uniref:hypothetical protein n=1 Tax=Acidiphilium sp. AL TaxID=2871704 RepID=UPI0021CAFF44|nr:hypothetical protein [Acidiphilium sp. AL]MCU4161741.1 hypothetical protein [Acidiphilium sp. AL]